MANEWEIRSKIFFPLPPTQTNLGTLKSRVRVFRCTGENTRRSSERIGHRVHMTSATRDFGCRRLSTPNERQRGLSSLDGVWCHFDRKNDLASQTLIQDDKTKIHKTCFFMFFEMTFFHQFCYFFMIFDYFSTIIYYFLDYFAIWNKYFVSWDKFISCFGVFAKSRKL